MIQAWAVIPPLAQQTTASFLQLAQTLSWPAYYLLVLSLVCAATDLKWGKIFNVITYPTILIGLVADWSMPITSSLLMMVGALFFLLGIVGVIVMVRSIIYPEFDLRLMPAVLIVPTVLIISASGAIAYFNWNTINALSLLLAEPSSIVPFFIKGDRLALIGFLFGFVPFALASMKGMIGGGDVKLFGAIGAMGGFPFILHYLFATFFVAFLFAILVLIWRRVPVDGFFGNLRNFGMTDPQQDENQDSKEDQTRIPMGVFGLFGCLLSLAYVYN